MHVQLRCRFQESQPLHNKPWLLDLPQGCSCPASAPHFVIEGTFAKASVVAFDARCKSSAVAVFGEAPVPGQSVASYSARYPIALMQRMAAGSLAASRGGGCSLPLSAQFCSLALASELAASELEPGPSRCFHEDPEWIGELVDSLCFKEVLRYKFRRPGHINVLEARMYKTFLKHAAKHRPCSRVLGLLDSRVTLGAAAKGRSSSPALCRVLQGSLPYLLGGGLYNGNLHVYSGQNRSDGPSRGRPVDAPTKGLPLWYSDLLVARPIGSTLCLPPLGFPNWQADGSDFSCFWGVI